MTLILLCVTITANTVCLVLNIRRCHQMTGRWLP